ncbi:MAG: polysaccharide deacetylase family protein [Candidatus Competibacteraceae bacterium]|nr:polysaccharide deacetylase family protein [Candidatus Competibacteraceae bacterium]
MNPKGNMAEEKPNGPSARSSGWRRAAIALGADRLARRFWGGCGAILMLHGLREDGTAGWEGNPGLGTTVGQLAALIETLRAEGYELVTLDAALERFAAPKSGARFACLTFDDGYRDNYELLYPLLRRFSAPATIYITTGFTDGWAPAWWHGVEAVLSRHPTLDLELSRRTHSFAASDPAARNSSFHQASALLREAKPFTRTRALTQVEQEYNIDFSALSQEKMLTWEMIREMAASGLVEFGAHTVTHPVLRGLPQEEARREMLWSRQRLETMLGRPARHFAYPYGDRAAVDTEVVALARDCGFASAVLAYGGPLRSGASLHALPRIPFGGDDSMDDLRIRLSGLKTALSPPALVYP